MRALPHVALGAVVMTMAALVPRLEGPREPVVLVGIALGCALPMMVAAVRHRAARPVWVRFAIGAVLLASHYAVFWVWPGVIPTAVVPFITFTAAASLIASGWGAVALARPLLSHPATRSTVLRGLPLGVLSVFAVPLSDLTMVRIGALPVRVAALLVPVAASVAIVVGYVRASRSLRSGGRTVELWVCFAVVTLTVATLPTAFDHQRFWSLPATLTTVVLAAASMTRSAALAGTPVDGQPIIGQVRFHWALAASLPLILALPTVHLGAPAILVVVCGVAATALVGAFARDLQRSTPVRRERAAGRTAVIANALPDALIHGGFDLHYQPIVRVHDSRVVGFEALLRWRHRDLGPVSPEEVIAAAEQFGFGELLELHIIEEVCSHLPHVLEHLDVDEPYLSVNVSPVSLQRPDFALRLLDGLLRKGLSIDGLVIEILERGTIDDWKALRANVETLQEHGAMVALDDFGTGTSNLQYLSEVDVDLVKLDRTLVQWATQGRGVAVISHLIAMARHAGARLVAEGVEDAATLAALRSAGVDFVQGYHLGRPAPLEAALEDAGRPLQRARRIQVPGDTRVALTE
jgi:EAL domain-containing protein (putative c-di-GMP-specific phosphodiesterase class I)